MSEALLRSLRSNGPVSPAIQFRKLLQYGRQRDWPFETAWRWSFERVKWPHDTTHRKEWKAVLGDRHDDPRPVPTKQREAWRSAYEGAAQSPKEQSVGLLVAA
jgi:hypothetical protein